VQQAQSAAQINQNIERITQAAVQSATGAQESAKAIDELNSLARDLARLVGHFRLHPEEGEQGKARVDRQFAPSALGARAGA